MEEFLLTQNTARLAPSTDRTNGCRFCLCRRPEVTVLQPRTGGCRIEVSPGCHGADLQVSDGSVPSSFNNFFAPRVSMSRKLQCMDSASAQSASSPWFRFLRRSMSIGSFLNLLVNPKGRGDRKLDGDFDGNNRSLRSPPSPHLSVAAQCGACDH